MKRPAIIAWNIEISWNLGDIASARCYCRPIPVDVAMSNAVGIKVREFSRSFGRNLSFYRRRLGWTQQRLATEAGVCEATIAKLEIGTTGARFQMVIRLAEAMQIDPEVLFGRASLRQADISERRQELFLLVESLRDDDIDRVYKLMNGSREAH